MPYPSEHAARVREPSEFQANSMRRMNQSGGVSLIMGRLKGSDKMTVQAYRFDKKKFTADEAREWLKKHGQKPISFEKAKD